MWDTLSTRSSCADQLGLLVNFLHLKKWEKPTRVESLCLPVWILTGLMSVSGAGESAAVLGQIVFAAHRKFEHFFLHCNAAKNGRFHGQF